MSETKRRVTLTQLHHLWEFLNNHREIAVGYNKSTQAREHSQRMWRRVAEVLNSTGEGALKSGPEWSKYWIDLKAKLKRKNRLINDSRKRTGGGPAPNLELSEMDRNFISILGQDYGSGLSGVQVDPLGQEYEDNTAGPSNTSQSTATEEPMYLEVISSEEYQQSEQNRAVVLRHSSELPIDDNISVQSCRLPVSVPAESQASPSRQGTTGQSPGRHRVLPAPRDQSVTPSRQGPRRRLELRVTTEPLTTPSRQGTPTNTTRRRRRRGRVTSAADARERLVISAEKRAEANLHSSRCLEKGVALLGEMVSILRGIQDRLPDAVARGAQQDPAS